MTDSKDNKECACETTIEIKTEETPKEAPKVEAQKTETIPEWANTLQQQLKSLEAKIGVAPKETPKPTATVSNDTEYLSLEKIAEKLPKHLAEYGKFEFTIPYDTLRNYAVNQVKTSKGLKESYRNNYETRKMITEAYSLSGTHVAIDQQPGVATVSGAMDYAPIRQLTKYVDISKTPGKSSATFYKKSLPSTLSQTVGTTATEASMTLTAINVNPSTVTGVYFKINTDDIENLPYSLVNEVMDAAAQTVVDFENDDILNVISKEGTLTPGLWCRGDSGATIASSDIASVTLDPTGVGTAVTYLRNQGYIKGGVRPVFVCHPTQFLQLIEDTEITNYVGFAKPEITTELSMAQFYGADIVISNSIEAKDNTTNDSWNALCFVPGHSYGSASKRDVTIKFHEVPEDNQIRVNTNWRFKSGVIDASSIVRVSTTQV